MVVSAFIDLLIVLSLTIVIEWAVVFLFGYRDRGVFLVVALINMVTNPLLNYVIAVINYLNLFEVTMPVLLIFESMVILAEWRLLNLATNEGSKKMLILSTAMNLSSFLLGLILQFLGNGRLLGF